MSLRVNHNLSAVNAHRNVVNNSNVQNKNMEKLSSGLRLNRGADGPAQLQISEQLRAQTAGLRQAIDNSEMAVSLMQTAEGALNEVSAALVQARQLAVHAANEGVNDANMLQADQSEFNHIVDQINRIAANTQYGKNYLLDGSGAGNGVTTGKNLEFVGAGVEAKSSGTGGYDIKITEAATRANYSGPVALSQNHIDAGAQITITEGGRSVNFKTIKGASVEQNMNELALAIKDAGLDIDLVRPPADETSGNVPPQTISLRHKQYGSEHTFQVSSNIAGLLSKEANVPVVVNNGRDVAGEIGGEESTGRGQVLTGGPGAGAAEGIQIRYTGENAPAGQKAGTVTFMQNSLKFQIGGNARQTTAVSFKSMKAADIGTGVLNDSGFTSLSDISLLNAENAQDAIRVIDQAIDEVSSTRGDMGAFQKNSLESNLNFLRIAHENTMSSESIIRDADMAEEMAAFTRNQIMMEASTSMLAQANQKSMTVLKLIG